MPLGGYQLGNRGFAGARGSYQRSHRALLYIQRDAVQNLSILVSEGHIPQSDVQAMEFFLLCRAVQFRLVQHRTNLTHNGRDFGKIIGKENSGDQRADNPQGQDRRCDEHRGR